MTINSARWACLRKDADVDLRNPLPQKLINFFLLSHKSKVYSFNFNVSVNCIHILFA